LPRRRVFAQPMVDMQGVHGDPSVSRSPSQCIKQHDGIDSPAQPHRDRFSRPDMARKMQGNAGVQQVRVRISDSRFP